MIVWGKEKGRNWVVGCIFDVLLYWEVIEFRGVSFEVWVWFFFLFGVVFDESLESNYIYYYYGWFTLKLYIVFFYYV